MLPRLRTRPRGSSPTAPARRVPAWQWGALIGFVLALVLIVAINLIRLDYVVLSPGPAINALSSTDEKGNAKPRIAVSGHPSYPAKGALDFTTVLVGGGPGSSISVAEWLEAKWRGYEIIPTDALYPPSTTKEQVKQQNTADMRTAQDVATVVAMRATGDTVTERLEVGDFAGNSKARSGVRKGDVIVAVNGTGVPSLASLHGVLAKVKPGATVRLGLLRGGQRVEVPVVTVPGEGRASVGILLRVDYNFPYKVTIDAGDVGGPSAGLMFSLAVYDTLTPGDLTGGQRIAGTGTIDDSGHVGPIGGIDQKMIGARDADARYFLAPAENCGEVRGHVPDGLQVVKVASFTEGRTAVERIAAGQARGLPTC